MSDQTLANVLALAGAIWYALLFAALTTLVRDVRRRTRAQRVVRVISDYRPARSRSEQIMQRVMEG